MALTSLNFRRNTFAKYYWLDRITPERHLLRGRKYSIAKRIMDLSIALVTLPILFGVLVTCAILIKLESPTGPIFFVQERTGKGGRRFKMYKFRTMVVNAEELKKELAAVNENGELDGP